MLYLFEKRIHKTILVLLINSSIKKVVAEYFCIYVIYACPREFDVSAFEKYMMTIK